eukprot:g28874.t1
MPILFAILTCANFVRFSMETVFFFENTKDPTDIIIVKFSWMLISSQELELSFLIFTGLFLLTNVLVLCVFFVSKSEKAFRRRPAVLIWIQLILRAAWAFGLSEVVLEFPATALGILNALAILFGFISFSDLAVDWAGLFTSVVSFSKRKKLERGLVVGSSLCFLLQLVLILGLTLDYVEMRYAGAFGTCAVALGMGMFFIFYDLVNCAGLDYLAFLSSSIRAACVLLAICFVGQTVCYMLATLAYADDLLDDQAFTVATIGLAMELTAIWLLTVMHRQGISSSRAPVSTRFSAEGSVHVLSTENKEQTVLDSPSIKKKFSESLPGSSHGGSVDPNPLSSSNHDLEITRPSQPNPDTLLLPPNQSENNSGRKGEESNSGRKGDESNGGRKGDHDEVTAEEEAEINRIMRGRVNNGESKRGSMLDRAQMLAAADVGAGSQVKAKPRASIKLDPTLPAGWTVVEREVNGKRKSYYWHKESNKSSWTRPVAECFTAATKSSVVFAMIGLPCRARGAFCYTSRGLVYRTCTQNFTDLESIIYTMQKQGCPRTGIISHWLPLSILPEARPFARDPPASFPPEAVLFPSPPQLKLGEIKRWRDMINFDEDQPAWPIILQIWKASGLKLDEALGYPISDDMDELFVKTEARGDSDRVVVVKEEKEEEGKLRLPEPEESTEELREVTRGMSVEVPAKEWGWNWAKRTYGPEWKSKTRKGVVEGECEPIRKGKKMQPAHFVRFEGEETENE